LAAAIVAAEMFFSLRFGVAFDVAALTIGHHFPAAAF
jgi:hypothetical protein